MAGAAGAGAAGAGAAGAGAAGAGAAGAGASGTGAAGAGAAGTGGAGAGDGTAGQETKFSEMATISLTSKIPDFWTDQPTLWFMQAEAMLTPQHLPDQVKFNLIITKLSKEVISQVTDILLNPPATGKFKALKDRLIHVYEETENRQIQKLISEMELGEQKPSQLLRRMKELARNKIGDDTLNVLWQGHLPVSVRTVLAVANITDLDNLATVADKIMENSKPLFVAEVGNARPVNPSSSTAEAGSSGNDSSTDRILKEIAKLNIRINKMDKRRSRSRSRSRNRSQQHRFRTPSRNSRKPLRTPESEDWLCKYHYRYRKDARNCVPPCSWKNQEN